MLDELIHDLEVIVREKYPLAARFRVSIGASTSDDIPCKIENVHVTFFIGDEMHSHPMWWLNDFREGLRQQITPAFDPILLGA